MTADVGPAVASAAVAGQVRDLVGGDLDRVVAIDAEGAGRPRPAVFAKRLVAGDGAGQAPADLALGVTDGAQLVGFACARIRDGEFGGHAPIGVLDALGVARSARRAGYGSVLLSALLDRLRAGGAVELHTQVWWTERDLLGFFGASGFRLSGQLVLQREVDAPFDDEFDADLSGVHTLAEADLAAVVRIDRRVTGRERTAYYRRLIADAVHRSGVRVSLVAQADGQPAGFLMARLDYGDFGLPEPVAVLDTIGVDPDRAGMHVGRTLLEQLLVNLRSLGVEQLRTEVGWESFDLMAFLARTGFAPTQRLALALDLRPR